MLKSQKIGFGITKSGYLCHWIHFIVVPKDQARIKVQLSAIHTRENLDAAISAFIKIGKTLKII